MPGEVQRHVRPEMSKESIPQAFRRRRESSFNVGIIRLVISNHTGVSFFSHASVSSTG